MDNSINIGGTSVAVDRLDPMFTPLLIGAYMREAQDLMSKEDVEDAVTDSILAGMSAAAGNTWAQSTLELMGIAARGDGAGFQKFLAETGYNLVPLGAGGSGIHRAISKQLDPNLKHIYEPFDVWLSDTDKQDKIDIYGDPVKHTKTLGGGISPFKSAQATKDPVKKEMAYLDVNPPKLREYVSVSSGGFAGSSAATGIKLSAEQYSKYASLVGQVKSGGKTLKEQLSTMIQSEDYAAIPEDKLAPIETGYKAEQILKVFRSYRKLALNTLMEGDTKLRDTVMQNSKRVAERKAGQSEETKEDFLESIQP
jgi:hypothetical protein